MLIRRCVAEDMPHLLEIWLQATLHAHDFLPAAAPGSDAAATATAPGYLGGRGPG